MYSVILMAAMTANTAEAPAFGHKAHGCQGGLYVHNACYGCTGCWGSCNGCTGCWGSCYGGYYTACYGCMGCYGGYSSGWSCGGCHGGWYGYGAYDGGMMMNPAGNPMQTGTTPPATGTTPPATGTTPPATGTTPPATGTKPPGGTTAKLIIEKPADAKIYVDDKLVTSEGTRQTFATPVLDPAQAYYYTVRVEAVRDGKPASETRRVIVRSGETVQETFRDAGSATASAAK